eukprot:tig00000147_g9458.t1
MTLCFASPAVPTLPPVCGRLGAQSSASCILRPASAPRQSLRFLTAHLGRAQRRSFEHGGACRRFLCTPVASAEPEQNEPSPNSPVPAPPGQADSDLQGGSRSFLDPGERWDVPWVLQDVAKWFGWSLVYTLAGAVLVVSPAVAILVGPQLDEMLQYGALGMPIDTSRLLDGRFESLVLVLLYALQMGAGLLALRTAITGPYGPRPDVFRFDFQGTSWLKWGFGGLLLALPLVNGAALVQALAEAGQEVQPQEITELALQAAGAGGAGPDAVTVAAILAVASVAAPVFEEVIFRGLVLTALTRYMPVWPAIFLDGLLFALSHGEPDQLLPLTAAGAVLAFVYAKSRNLAASALAHALWNGSTLLLLLGLALAGAVPADLLGSNPV